MPLHHHLKKKVEHKHTTMALALALAVATSFLNLAAMPFGSAQAQEGGSPDSNVTAPAVQPDTSQPQPPVREPAPQPTPEPAPAPQSAPERPIAEPAPGNSKQCPPGEEPGVNDQGQQSCIRRGGSGEQSMPDKGRQGGPGGIEDENGGQEEQPVDPRELRNALQQVRQLRLEIRSLLRQLTQMKDATNRAEDLAALKALDARAVELGTGISKEQSREALQEFFEARLWDEVQGFRAKIQLPKDLKDMARAITKVEKLLKSKSTQKYLDVARLQTCFDQVKAAHAESNSLYQAGNLEEAQEAIQELHQSGMHPGGMEGAIHRTRGVSDLLKRIRDKEIKAAVIEILAPVYEALYECDFSEFHNIMNDYEDDLRRLVSLISRTRGGLSKVESKIGALEDLIRAKSDSLDQQQQGSQGGNSAPAQ